MEHTDFRRPLPAGPAVDVLDSGGDERRRRDLERLKALAVGAVAGALASVAVSHVSSSAPVDTPQSNPAAHPAASTPALAPAPALPAYGVRATDCPVRVRVRTVTEPGGPWVCFGTADAAVSWLEARRAGHEYPGLDRRS